MNYVLDQGKSELTLEQQRAETLKQMREDWVKTYPDLANEDLRPLVGHVSQRLAQERGYKEWNATVRDEIAAEVRKILGRSAAPQGDGGGHQQEKAPAKPKTPYQARGSSRAGAAPAQDKLQQEISDVLGF